MTTVAVLDYGMGNLHSVCKALEHVAPKHKVVLTAEAETLLQADKVVVPGQGAIIGCLSALQERGLRQALMECIRNKPYLGICLGLQALYDSSDEGGGVTCLGVIPGQVRHFADKGIDTAEQGRLKIPHMGWNQVRQTHDHPLWSGIPQDTRFYFVHSYYADTKDDENVAGTTNYGIDFTSVAARQNIFAVQFHPEKSQKYGLRLLQNFVTWNGEA